MPAANVRATWYGQPRHPNRHGVLPRDVAPLTRPTLLRSIRTPYHLAPMTATLRILLASPDLMAGSQLASLAREAEASIETLRSLDGTPAGGPYDLLLLDLQGIAGDPAVTVPRFRQLAGVAADQRPPLVAFGPHVAKQRLADARAAGADDAVSRGELLGGFAALVRRWCASA